MQKLKVFLLSNSFMAKIAVILGLHKYMFNVEQSQRSEILKFVNSLQLNQKFNSFVKDHQENTPKILSDVWESLIGAILIDGGWKAVQTVIGNIIAPYLVFCVKYFQNLKFDILNLLQIYLNRNKKKFLLQTNPFENEFISILIIDGEYFCEKSGKNIKVSRLNCAEEACKILKLI